MQKTTYNSHDPDIRVVNYLHSDFTLQRSSTSAFYQDMCFLKVNLSSEIDQICEMHEPFHSFCLANSLIIAELTVESKTMTSCEEQRDTTLTF